MPDPRRHVPPAPDFGAPLSPVVCPETLALLARRRSASAQSLVAPAPDDAELADLLRLAARTPDHGKMTPWRFVVLRGEAKARFVEGLREIAAVRPDRDKALAALRKIEVPPLAVAVVSAPRTGGKPVWEQRFSAAAVCTLLLVASGAMGFGANWITDWYGDDPRALELLGLKLKIDPAESLAGWLMLGTPSEPPMERVRPDMDRLVTAWS